MKGLIELKYFVYGTLMRPEMLHQLHLEVKSFQVATMKGVTLYAPSPKAFPFMKYTGNKSHEVTGLILELDSVHPEGFSTDFILDSYEGIMSPTSMYTKKVVNNIAFYLANMSNKNINAICNSEHYHIGGDWDEFQTRAQIHKA